MIKYQLRSPATEIDRSFLHEVLGFESAGSKHGSTRWKRMRRCAREEQLYTLGVRRRAIPVKDRDGIDFGTLFHMGLEAFYKAMKGGADYRASVAQCWRALEVMDSATGYEGTMDDLDKTLTSYFEFAYNDDWEILAVEHTLERIVHREIMLRGERIIVNVPYSARLDLIIRDRVTKGVRIVEHKSTKRMTDDYLRGYQADIQTLGQDWLVRPMLGLLGRYDGLTVNISVRPTKEKAPQHHRANFLFTERHIDEFEHTMARQHLLNELARDLEYPKAFGNCSGAVQWFKACPYFDACHNAPEFVIKDSMTDDDLPYGYTMRGDIPLEE